MASRKRLASWSTALSQEREAREEAEDEQLAAERQVDELQDQIAEVEAEREGLESRLVVVGAEREAHAETERDLEEALEQLQTAEELTDSLKAELQALRGGESARKRASPECIGLVIVCFFDVHIYFFFLPLPPRFRAGAPAEVVREADRQATSDHDGVDRDGRPGRLDSNRQLLGARA